MKILRFTKFVSAIWIFLFAILPFVPANADFLNLTGASSSRNIAEIYVLDNKVRIALEIFVEDLEMFKEIVPDNLLVGSEKGRASLNERLQVFSDSVFQVVMEDGTKLPANLILAEPRLRKDRYAPFAGSINPTTGRKIPGPPEDKRVIYAELEYPFSEKPEKLTFIPPLDDRGAPLVPIGFIAYHKTVPVIDFRFLSKAAKIILDWTDPWYTRFDDPNLRRHHNSPAMSFLYVGPREVRHEILFRLRNLGEWANLDITNRENIDSVEIAGIKEKVNAFFMKHNPVKVEGMPAIPSGSRAEFLKVAERGLQVIDDVKSLDLSTALIGVILTYPVKQLPKSVSVEWELFSERLKSVPTLSTDPAGPFPGSVSAEDPILEWKNHLVKFQDPKVLSVTVDHRPSIPIPVLSAVLVLIAVGLAVSALLTSMIRKSVLLALSVVLIISALVVHRIAVVNLNMPFATSPDEKQSAQIITDVLENINHALMETQPTVLREKLGVVIIPEVVEAEKKEVSKALEVNILGGGKARTSEINNLVASEIQKLEGKPGFRALAEWTAKVKGGHWGHQHLRFVQYRALVELEEREEVWKLAGVTVLDAKFKK